MLKYFMISAALIISFASFKALTSDRPHHVVIQVSTNDTAVWKMTMSNIRNLKLNWDDGVYIEVVAFGPGLDLLTSATSIEQKHIEEFAKKGVKFMACENSMKAKNVHKKDLVDDAGTVPAGVAEIVLKQEAGWSYLKAGY
jgi:intracellular sulfur oxidation DsrE/DsrF family protein